MITIIVLRDYQENGINDIRNEFRKTRKVCYVLPCGGGKTLIMSFMSSEAEKKGKRTIFLVHRRELIQQASKTLTMYGIPHGINGNTNHLIQIASVQTAVRRLDKLEKPDLVIPDECHHATAATWKKCLEYWGESYVVGLTATPSRMGGQGLGDVFESMVIGPTAKELIRLGYLTSYKYYAPPMVADLDGLNIKMGDFDSAEVEERVNKPKVIGDAISHYIKLAFGKQAIAYCASVLHSQNTAAAFNSAGITAKHIDGTTPTPERDQAIEDFRTGKITILCNVDLIGEGFDVPTMEVVILLRPTHSLTLYIQQSMRPLRPDKINPDKVAIILDHVGNVFRHGLPDEDREWSLQSKARGKKNKEPSVGIKQCPECFAAHDPGPICPECKYVYPVKPRELEEEDGDLKEIVAIDKKEKRMAVGQCKTIDDLKKIAEERGYKSSWVHIQAKLKNIRS